MYIDTNVLPEDFSDIDFLAQLKSLMILPIDPIMSTTNTSASNGVFSQINDFYKDKITEMDLQIGNLYLQNKLLTLKILVLEGVFTKEEANNIKVMLMSYDEASITLADTLIENA